MIDDALLAAMKLRLAMTTPGPWVSYLEGRDQMSGSDFIMTGGEDIYLTGATADDQEFIAHARQDIALLIDEIERLRAGHVGG
jgi:hypothetical protein